MININDFFTQESILVSTKTKAKKTVRLVGHGLKKSIHVGTIFENHLSNFEILNKTLAIGLKIMGLAYPLSSPLVDDLNFKVKEIKEYLGFLKGLRSFDELMSSSKSSWCVIALNVSGTVMLMFSILNFTQKFKIVDITPLCQVFERVPLFGLLPFAGIPNLACISLLAFGCLLGMKKNQAYIERGQKIEAKIVLYNKQTPFSKEEYERRQTKYASKIKEFKGNEPDVLKELKAKQEYWKNILSAEQQLAFIENKKTVWEPKQRENDKNRILNQISLIKKIVGIASVIILSLGILTPIPFFNPLLIGLAVGIVDLTLDYGYIAAKKLI